MRSEIVFSFIGDDQSGLVGRVSAVVGQHGGNWLQSRLSRLGGKFAGIIQVEVAEDRADGLIAAIENLSSDGLSVMCERCGQPRPGSEEQVLKLHLVGPDRRHIVEEVSAALATEHISVTDLSTEVIPAPMSGELMFHAEAIIAVPQGADPQALEARLDEISQALTIEIDLEPDED